MTIEAMPTAQAGGQFPADGNGADLEPPRRAQRRARRDRDRGVAAVAARGVLPARPGARRRAAAGAAARGAEGDGPAAGHLATPTSTRSRSSANRPTPATATSSSASRASCAGTRWRWSSTPTTRPRASAATFPPTPRRPRSTRWASTTSSAARTTRAAATWSTSRATLARHLRARLPGGAAQRAPAASLPPRAGRGRGLPSYPHPWLMEDFWKFPTVSMGLAPLMGIYQARFMRYLVDRGLKEPTDAKVWVFLGDGETDAGGAGRDLAGGARAARQPDLRDSTATCSASTARSAATARSSRNWRRLPRRGLERDQGAVGRRVGRAAGARRRRPAGQAHGRGRRRRVPEVHGRRRRLRPRALLRRGPAAAAHGPAHERRRAVVDAPRRPRPGQGPRRLPRRSAPRGRADRHPRAHDQGLRPRRGGRGQEHHAPAEEAQRRRADALPRPLRDSR